MARPKSWIKLNRNILGWGWYKDINTKTLFIHLLLTANIDDCIFMGVPVKRGELVTSYPKLAEELNLSIKSVRTALNHLKETGEVAVRTYPKFSLIVIENYEKYQDVPEEMNQKRNFKKRGGRQNGSQTAGNGQSKGSQGAGDGQQYKNIRNIRNKEYKNIGASPSLPSAVSSGYVPKEWERDEVPEMLWGKFETVAEWEAWRDK